MTNPLYNICPELYIEMSRNMANRIQATSIEAVILMDVSARLAYLGINRVLRKDYPHLPKPDIYFVNPQATSLLGDLDRKSFFTRRTLRKEIKRSYPYLFERRKKNVMVADVCMHSGRNAQLIMEGFSRVGFTNLSFGLLQPPSLDPLILLKRNLGLNGSLETPTPDFEFLNTHIGCRPFGFDECIRKTEYLCSKSYKNRPSSHSLLLRRQISQFLENNGYPL